jgi:rhamnulokinase
VLRVLAVDLGATSARVAAIDLDAHPVAMEIVHRHSHQPLRVSGDGSLRWDWQTLLCEVTRGLEMGLRRGPVASIGVDTWGVDYGLIDGRGELVSPPVSYRDERTAGWRSVVERIGAERLYRITGIQLMAINTLFQLAAHDRAELARAHRLLMLPELVVHALTGVATGERTSAGTTALVRHGEDRWSEELIEELGLDPSLFPEIARPPRRVGSWRGIPVQLVAGHDTASAVAALPAGLTPGAAFISSGTWMLVGAERPKADTSDAAFRANFSNEPGAVSGVRFLKNVIGLVMLEKCCRAWANPQLASLLEAAARVASRARIDAMDPRFLNPDDMESEIRAAAGLSRNAGRAEVARCILDSLAEAAVGVVAELGDFLGAPVSEICIIGGGCRNWVLNRLIEERSGLSVRVGSAEATALGNALLQGIALGRFTDLENAREALAHPE